jgi:dihydroorotate dehydrogenase (fumarate)
VTADLSTTYLGLELRTPIVASPSPLTGELDTLLEIEEAGAAAVVLPSLFEEQLVEESLGLSQVLDRGTEAFAEALDYYPDLPDYGVGPDQYLDLLHTAKERLTIPVLASLNADSAGGWVRYAELLEQAGADAIELNIYAIAADMERSSTDVETEQIEIVREVRAALHVPLAVKLAPYYSSMAHFAAQVAEAGADGLVLFNRFYQPDLDLETLDVVPRVDLSEPWELRLPLRWIAILYGRVDACLAVTSGVGDAEAVAKVLLAGGDVAMMTSALLRKGPGHIRAVERDLRSWLDEHEYESVRQLRGSVSMRGATNPSAYERANYRRTLGSYQLPSREQR